MCIFSEGCREMDEDKNNRIQNWLIILTFAVFAIGFILAWALT